jgi:anti-sigma28 factor (negative regulator of flagellin synthesis)
MSADEKDSMRHRPADNPSERDLAQLREQVEEGTYEVRPTDVADAILRRGMLGGFRLPRSIRPG